MSLSSYYIASKDKTQNNNITVYEKPIVHGIHARLS